MQQVNTEELNICETKQDESIIVSETMYEKPLTCLEWIGSVFLLSIPFVNVVSCVVFILLRGKSKNRSNYVIASLIISLSLIIKPPLSFT